MASIELVSERAAEQICGRCEYRQEVLGGFVCANLGREIVNRAVTALADRHQIDHLGRLDTITIVSRGQPAELVRMTRGYWDDCHELSDKALIIMAQACAAAHRNHYVHSADLPEDTGFRPPHLFSPQDLVQGLFVDGI